MTDPYQPDDDASDSDQDDDNGSDKDNLKALRQKARQADELAAKLATMERNEAFRSAGLDPNDPKAKYFVKGYDGEVNVDAIRTAATEAGFLASQQDQNQPSQGYTPDAMQRIFAATAGGQAPAPQDWQGALAEADRIADPQAREDAILSVVERYGGVTSRTAQ